MFDDSGMGSIDQSVGVPIVPPRIEKQRDVENGRHGVEGAEGEFIQTTVLSAGNNGLADAGGSRDIVLPQALVQTDCAQDPTNPSSVHGCIVMACPHLALTW